MVLADDGLTDVRDERVLWLHADQECQPAARLVHNPSMRSSFFA